MQSGIYITEKMNGSQFAVVIANLSKQHQGTGIYMYWLCQEVSDFSKMTQR